MQDNIPLLETDPQKESVTSPREHIRHHTKSQGIEEFELPKYCVLSFYSELCDTVEEKFNPKVINFHTDYPFYVFDYEDITVVFTHPLIGASYSGAVLEEMIALGGKYFIFFGSVGTIDPKVERNDLIVPTKALRQEGTSYHYQEPDRYSYPSELVLKAIKETLKERNLSFHEGGTWTTDAFYRETKENVKEYAKEGILTVEMEASALFSIGKYRDVDIGGLFLGGDYVGEEGWEPRMEGEHLSGKKAKKEEVLNWMLQALLKLDEIKQN